MLAISFCMEVWGPKKVVSEELFSSRPKCQGLLALPAFSFRCDIDEFIDFFLEDVASSPSIVEWACDLAGVEEKCGVLLVARPDP